MIKSFFIYVLLLGLSGESVFARLKVKLPSGDYTVKRLHLSGNPGVTLLFQEDDKGLTLLPGSRLTSYKVLDYKRELAWMISSDQLFQITLQDTAPFDNDDKIFAHGVLIHG